MTTVRNEEDQFDFPKLMVTHDLPSLVVLFSEEGIGVIVDVEGVPDSTIKIGRYSESWDMDEFFDFHGSVTLKN